MQANQATLNKLRAIFAKAAHTNQDGEARAFASKGFEMFNRYGFSLKDLTKGQKRKEAEYIVHNFIHAQRIWQAQDKATGKAKKTSETNSDGQTTRVWVNGYTRKDGRQVKGYWRTGTASTKAKKDQMGPNGETRDGFIWVNGYTRADGREVRGYWRRLRYFK